MTVYRDGIWFRSRLAAAAWWLATSVGPAFVLTSVTVCPSAAHASTFIELSFPELLARSTSVAVVTPLDSHCVWEERDREKGRRIVTYTRVRVDRMVDGAPLDETWVRTLGGRIGDLGQQVDGDAVLVPQRTTLLFLSALPDGPHAVVGMAQGQYPLDASKSGEPPRLLFPLSSGRLLPSSVAAGPQLPSARTTLVGKTVEQVADLIAGARRAHAR